MGSATLAGGRLIGSALINSRLWRRISWWREFVTFRNRLPLIDHNLIVDAEASDLAKTYCCSTLDPILDADLLVVLATCP